MQYIPVIVIMNLPQLHNGMLVADVAVGNLHLDCEHHHVRGCRTSEFQLETLKSVYCVVMVNCPSQMQGMHCMPERQLRKCNF